MPFKVKVTFTHDSPWPDFTDIYENITEIRWYYPLSLPEPKIIFVPDIEGKWNTYCNRQNNRLKSYKSW